jgi:predicted Fe-Mo cluster-binding NifX family protein
MTAKVAIPLFGDRISSRLDCSECILLVDIDRGRIITRQEMRWAHTNFIEKIHLLHEEDVKVLICGGLTEACSNMLRDAGIGVLPWIRGNVEEVLCKFVNGTLHVTTEK